MLGGKKVDRFFSNFDVIQKTPKKHFKIWMFYVIFLTSKVNDTRFFVMTFTFTR